MGAVDVARTQSSAFQFAELAYLAGGCAVAFDGLAANYPVHRGIASEAASVVHVLVAGETAID
jgi:hypothetical protein